MNGGPNFPTRRKSTWLIRINKVQLVPSSGRPRRAVDPEISWTYEHRMIIFPNS